MGLVDQPEKRTGKRAEETSDEWVDGDGIRRVVAAGDVIPDDYTPLGKKAAPKAANKARKTAEDK